MKAEDLWIGDRIQIKSSLLKGRFEGMENDQAKIKCDDGKIITTTLSDIGLIPEDTMDHPILFNSPLDKKEIKKEWSRVKASQNILDLHYESLQENYPRTHRHILQYQLEVCEEFLNDMIDQSVSFARIIHGRGQGILKKEVETLLRRYNEIGLFSAHPDQGSIDIYFK